jgi:hypothetical protein
MEFSNLGFSIVGILRFGNGFSFLGILKTGNSLGFLPITDVPPSLPKTNQSSYEFPPRFNHKSNQPYETAMFNLVQICTRFLLP